MSSVGSGGTEISRGSAETYELLRGRILMETSVSTCIWSSLCVYNCQVRLQRAWATERATLERLLPGRLGSLHALLNLLSSMVEPLVTPYWLLTNTNIFKEATPSGQEVNAWVPAPSVGFLSDKLLALYIRQKRNKVTANTESGKLVSI